MKEIKFSASLAFIILLFVSCKKEYSPPIIEWNESIGEEYLLELNSDNEAVEVSFDIILKAEAGIENFSLIKEGIVLHVGREWKDKEEFTYKFTQFFSKVDFVNKDTLEFNFELRDNKGEVASKTLVVKSNILITIEAAADAFVDLGETYDPIAEANINGTTADNVNIAWLPEWNNEVVNHYVATLFSGDASATQNVYVQVDKLAKTYDVTEFIDGVGTFNYPVSVTRADWNKLHFNEFIFNDVIVEAIVAGTNITIAPQNFELDDEFAFTIQGTGSYDGAAQKITTIAYVIDYGGGDIEEGTITFN